MRTRWIDTERVVDVMVGRRKYSAANVRKLCGHGARLDAVMLALNKGVQAGVIDEGEYRGARWYRLR